MRRTILLITAVATLAALALAQQTRAYDPTTETTVTGTVEDVMQVAHGGRSTGTHLKLKTNAEVIEVQLGPTLYLESQKFAVAKGDTITVTGSKVKDSIVAREVKKGDTTLTLRDSQGVPKWSRGAARTTN